jgi:hypothetical protein
VRIFFIRFVVAFAKAVVNGDGWSQRDDEQTASHPRHLILLGQTEFVIYNGEMTRIVTKPNQKSAMPTLPTLSQMVRDGQADAIQHRRRTREALDYRFRQSERLTSLTLIMDCAAPASRISPVGLASIVPARSDLSS